MDRTLNSRGGVNHEAELRIKKLLQILGINQTGQAKGYDVDMHFEAIQSLVDKGDALCLTTVNVPLNR